MLLAREPVDPRNPGDIAISALNHLLPKSGGVVLHSLPDLDDSVIALADELIARGVKPTILVDSPISQVWAAKRWNYDVSVLLRRSVAGMRAYLTAQCMFTTHGVFGSRPTPHGQIVVNMWHGEPPCKPVGRFDRDGVTHADYATVCSTVGRAYRASEFGIDPRHVLITGVPRNDRMLRADPALVRSSLKLPPDEQLWVWLPTYRTAVRGAQRQDSTEDYAGLLMSQGELVALNEELQAQNARVILKAHPLASSDFELDCSNISLITDADLRGAGVSLYELLAGSDGLITDISSVWVDYLLLDRPIVIFFPDLDEYREHRGFNLEPYESWIPGELVRTGSELAKALQEAGAEHWSQLRGRLRSQLHAYTDAGSAGRLLDELKIGTPPEGWTPDADPIRGNE
jgi:CDP-glycerol glycerophosphotransferase (TagB/SpsB family)